MPLSDLFTLVVSSVTFYCHIFMSKANSSDSCKCNSHINFSYEVSIAALSIGMAKTIFLVKFVLSSTSLRITSNFLWY